MYIGIENFDLNREKEYVEMWEGNIAETAIILSPMLLFLLR